MVDLTLRNVKGSELTFQELDDNFTNLATAIGEGSGSPYVASYDANLADWNAPGTRPEILIGTLVDVSMGEGLEGFILGDFVFNTYRDSNVQKGASYVSIMQFTPNVLTDPAGGLEVWTSPIISRPTGEPQNYTGGSGIFAGQLYVKDPIISVDNLLSGELWYLAGGLGAAYIWNNNFSLKYKVIPSGFTPETN